MPPKKQGGKSVDKAKQKAVEDKTFGLKNKNKSSKVAKYVQQVQQQASQQARQNQVHEWWSEWIYKSADLV